MSAPNQTRSRRRREGRCRDCDMPYVDPTGKTFACPACREKVRATNRIKHRAKVAQRFKEGKCTVCTRPWYGRTMMCAMCKRDTNAARTKKRAAEGLTRSPGRPISRIGMELMDIHNDE